MLRKKVIIVLGAAAWVLLAVLLVSNFIPVRTTSAQNACVNNLRQIDGAKQEWALEHPDKTNQIVTWDDIQPYCGRGPKGSILKCPQGGTYILGRAGQPPRCSIGGTHTLN
jgi:hypothetical protein